MRPTVAEIRIGALVGNYRALAERVRASGGAGLIAVVKADAYGHGVELCGRALVRAGAGWLGVTAGEEARVLLRALGGLPRPRVLVMSGFFPGEEEAVLRTGVTPQVWEPWHVRLLHEAARRAGLGPRSVAVHLEIDTGMSRQGVAPGDALAALLRALGNAPPPLWVEGVMTHFSSPEDSAITRGQVELLRTALGQARMAGARPRWIHAGNSLNASCGAALWELRGLAREIGAELLVRPGLGLYGIDPAVQARAAQQEPGTRDTGQRTPGLEPVMRWRTEVVSIRQVAPGTPVGYGETFRAPAGGARLALLPVGYADGLRRELSNRGFALVRGQRAPVVGRVSMDQSVVDVSGAEVSVGDEAVLLGRQGDGEIGAWEMAGWFGGIAYEAVCGVGGRVPRIEIA